MGRKRKTLFEKEIARIVAKMKREIFEESTAERQQRKALEKKLREFWSKELNVPIKNVHVKTLPLAPYYQLMIEGYFQTEEEAKEFAKKYEGKFRGKIVAWEFEIPIEHYREALKDIWEMERES